MECQASESCESTIDAIRRDEGSVCLLALSLLEIVNYAGGGCR